MSLRFSSRQAHREFVAAQAPLPRGFRAGATSLSFTSAESGKIAKMNISLIALDKPSPDFAGMFTRNAFPGAPVKVGRKRLAESVLSAIVVNNKVSNVATPTGIADAQAICDAVGKALGVDGNTVMPSSTGVIGWRLPTDQIIAGIPGAVASLQRDTIFPIAEAIMTTDLYPKVRSAQVGDGRIVAIAKGAGMIEPHLATMLVFILTDLQIPRDTLRAILPRAVDGSFNCLSVDSDTSTSDTVLAVSSGLVPCPDVAAFESALTAVCSALAGDVVRNGEGVHHVIRITVSNAPDRELARRLGRAVVNSPLVKTAVLGNDPNVGRIAAALGKQLGLDEAARSISTDRVRIAIGGQDVMVGGQFHLNGAIEKRLSALFKSAELYSSAPNAEGNFVPPIDYPPHEDTVDILVDLGSGTAECTVLGADLSHEYVTENADYRS